MNNIKNLGALVLLAISLVAAVIAVSFRVSFPTDPLGPRVFPFVAAALLAIGVPALLRSPSIPSDADARGHRRVAIAIVAFFAYAALLSPLGFVTATAGVFAVLAILFGGSPLESCVAGVCSALLLYAVFVYGLGLPLPLGFAAQRLVG